MHKSEANRYADNADVADFSGDFSLDLIRVDPPHPRYPRIYLLWSLSASIYAYASFNRALVQHRKAIQHIAHTYDQILRSVQFVSHRPVADRIA